MRRLARFGIITWMAALVACGGSGALGPTAVVGTYSLQSVNGSPLPYRDISGGATQVTFQSRLTLYGNGAYGRADQESWLNGGQWTPATVTDSGTYAAAGGALTLRSNGGGGAFSATAVGGQLTLSWFGATYVYIRQ